MRVPDRAAIPVGTSDQPRLDSWKAIAAYLNRDVRTVQRWEAKESLPVHRLQHDRLASVYAFASEIDAWVLQRSTGPKAPPQASGAEVVAGGAQPDAPAGRLEQRDVAALVVCIARPGQLADERSPEQLRHDITRLNELLLSSRDRFGAEVLASFGETAVLAFGLTRAEEDDALRAARAARWLVQAADAVGIGVTGGLAFGPLLAGPTPSVSTPLAGAVMDEARRLATRAEEGEVLAGPTVWRIIAPFFDSTDRETIAIGGQPVTVRALGAEAAAHSRFDAAARRGLTAFVGRAAELQRLLNAWEAARTSAGRILHVLGEAGMGKSRLLLEFRRAIGPGTCSLAHGRCIAPGKTASYRPLVEAFSELLTLAPEAHGEDVVAGAVRVFDASLEPFVPHYLHLLGVASTRYPLPSYLQGIELKVALREALAAAFLAAAERKPLMLCLEDWHWADAGSIDVLQQLAHHANSAALLVLVTSRLDGLSVEAVPPGAETLSIEPLTEEETGELVASLVAGGRISPAFVRQVYARTGGNPFFVEELCESLREEGRDASTVEGLQIPATVQALIRARIDRLDPEDREVLRTAAVIGRECQRDLLAQIVSDPSRLDDNLRRLTSARILQALRLGANATFRFKHNLTQEVAYLSLPAFERKALHRRVAELLCVMHAEALEQHADLLAFHFHRSESWAPATRFALRAARRAFALTEFGRAIELLEQAQRSYSHLSGDDVDARLLGEILLLEERACEPRGDRSEQEGLLARALQVLEEGSHADLLAEALIRLGDLRTIQAQFDEAQDLIARALDLCRTTRHRAAERSAWRSWAFSKWRSGDNEAAIRGNEEALAIARELGDRDGVAIDLASIAAVLRVQGRHEAALARLAEAETIEGLTPVAASYAYQVSSSVFTTIGDRSHAAEILEHVVTRIQTPGHVPIHRVFSMLSLARLRLEAGEIGPAEELFGECVSRCRQLQYAHGLSMTLPGLAETHIARGRWAAAASCLEEALAVFDRLHETEGVIDHWERLSWLRVQLGDATGARDAAERAAEVALRLKSGARACGIFERLARGLAESGAAHADVRATFERAMQLAPAEDGLVRGRLLNALGIAEFSAAQYGRARQRFEQALRVFERQGPSEAVALMLNSIGAALRALGRRHEAIRQVEAALAALDRADEPRLRGHAMALLGDIYRELGDQDAARTWYERTVDLRRRLGDRTGEAWMCQRMALLHVDAGLTDLARAQVAAAQQLCSFDTPPALRDALAVLDTQLSVP